MLRSNDWTTHQLTEFLAEISCSSSEDSALRRAVERAAEALEAEVGAFISDGEVVASVGFPARHNPVDSLIAVAAAGGGTLEVTGLGPCYAVVVRVDNEVGDLVLARSDQAFACEEFVLLNGMARVLKLTLDMLKILTNERALHERTQQQAEENATLLRSLEERQALLEKLSRIQRSISHRAPLDEVLDAITAGAAELFQGEIVALRLIDPDDPDWLMLHSSSGIPGSLLDAMGRTPLTDGVGGRAIIEERLVIMDDYASSTHAMFPFASDDLQTAMGVPVHEGGKVVGSLVVASYEKGRHYNITEQETLSAFADHASLALTDARTLEQMREQTRFVKLLRSIAIISNEATTVQDAMNACIDVVRQHTGWTDGRTHLIQGDLLGDLFRSSDATADDALAPGYRSPAIRRTLDRVATTLAPSWDEEESGGNLFFFPIVDNEMVAALLEFRSDSEAEPDKRALELMDHVCVQLGKVAERKRLEGEIEYRAFHDALTELANRALFLDRVDHALARQSRTEAQLAVLFIDLDDFKTVNDSLGHHAGDELLVEITRRLRATLRPADTIARLGGDEFAVLLEETGLDEAIQIVERIIRAIGEPFILQGQEVFPRASVGIAVGCGDTSATEILRGADAAMYTAKNSDKDSYRVFEPAMHSSVLERLSMKADLERAIGNKELVLHYQPVMALQSGRIVGVEALVRWQHPVRGLVGPLDFIPLAEETGLIVPIGRWILESATRQVKEWQRLYPAAEQCFMTVNFSPRQLQEPDVVPMISEVVDAAGLDPADFVIEITETVLMSDGEATIPKLRDLRGLGIRIAIDDFGTGYSSLGYLSRLPLDILKIDKAFTETVAEGPEGAALTRAVITLGDTLGLQTVAEGIETAAQEEALKRLGCGLGQGYHLARPMDAQVLSDMFDSIGRNLVQPGGEV